MVAVPAQHIQFTVRVSNTGVPRDGFGKGLILSYTTLWADRSRDYSSLAALLSDGFAADGPEALAATAMMAQSPHPVAFTIGRGTRKPTLVYEVDIAAVRNLYVYSLKVKGQGVTATTVTATSDGTATNDEIADLLVTALNAVVGKNYTAAATGSGGSHVVTITASAAGNWFSIEVVNVNDLTVAATHVDPGVAADLAEILLVDNSWYELTTLFNSQLYVLAAAAWVEANNREYIVAVNDTKAITTVVSGATDTVGVLNALGYTRTMIGYHPNPASFFGPAWAGRLLPLNPGKWTAKFKTLAGVEPVVLTDTQRTNLLNRRGNTYTTDGGRNITWEGTVGSTVYGFLDVTVSLDWLRDELTKRAYGVLVSLDKVGYDDHDIALIEGEVRGGLMLAASDEYNILRQDPAPTITFPLVEDISASNRALRNLPDGEFTGQLDGAVQKIILDGVLTF